MFSLLGPAFLIPSMFAADKSNRRAMAKMKFIYSINISSWVHRQCFVQKNAHGKEPAIQESCSRSNTADAYFFDDGKAAGAN
jgi:hypothetical protein